jgi:hypothetical protein
MDELQKNNWTIKTGINNDKEHDGYIKAQSHYLIAANETMINILGTVEF